ncbi:hypothetical protein H6P81_010435 [Aristolochia fimbriata]|uniref:Integrase catalytic domain-containing protein n=1 Tax=Aristolochia fimbriata TaxID=158543 RepID=A0AAV7ENR7_ARIFI|nr:hypothetical protein H6P81_010435 [Aristolochia fimbriata]
MIEKQTGRQIKRLRTDNGLEFSSGEFNKFCKDEGIVRHHTVRHTPQQNGVAERMNRNLLERARCMLSNAGLGKDFWAEATSMACYLVNLSPSTTIEYKTPKEVWSGTPADYSDLKVFGCTAYMHVNEGKLEPRTKKCIFLGYATGVKGYGLWYFDPKSQRFFISRDVTFDESAFLNVKKESTISLGTREEPESSKKVVSETIDESEPSTFKEAIQSDNSERWKEGILGVEDARYKACLVAKGYSQVPGVDFNDVFSPVVKHSSIRVLLAFVAMHDLELEQLDVKTTFLHGELEEQISIHQPEGFVVEGKEGHVCLVTKYLYCLKQSPRQWYKRFDSFMKKIGYFRSKYDNCVYFRKLDDGSFVYLLLYVDDMLIEAKEMEQINQLKTQLRGEFEMKDLGATKRILGIEIERDRKGLSPQNEKEKGYMLYVPYTSAVGCLMYAMICTRPDISHAVSVVSRFMSNPGREHWQEIKWILRYLIAGKLHYNMHVVALSTTKAKYMAVTKAVKEAIWLQGLYRESSTNDEVIVVFCDSQSVIHLTKDQMHHERTKHIDVRFHFIKDTIAQGTVMVKKIGTEDNLADMLTKSLPVKKFEHCLDLVGVFDG